jgi:methylated-DNA-[protein]-cysteine S-methyltransferase
LYQYYYQSPIGRLLITYNDNSIIGIGFESLVEKESTKNKVLDYCISELDAYFNGKINEFTVPISLELGKTEFRGRVWQALICIPYGEVASYVDIATAIGQPKAARAVGGANNKNPIPIIVPCHRIVGADGSLVGYAGELWRKEWLLNHEKKHIAKQLSISNNALG